MMATLDDTVRDLVAAEVAARLPAAVRAELAAMVADGRVVVREDVPFADLDALTGLAPALPSPAPLRKAG